MIRAFILFFNFIFILLMNLFSDSVNIDQKMPASVKAGSEFTVEVIITKGSVSGFARFQHELPAGFTATAVALDGAGFTFEAQKAKFVWASLPSATTLKISYKVKVDDNVSGDFVINGKFSYIDNGTSTSSTNTQNIHVEGSATAVKTTTPPDSTVATTTPNTTPVKPDSTVKAPSVITCRRTVPTDPAGNDFVVELRLNKGSVTGFAKLEDELPTGYTATAVSSANAEFKFEKQKAKFIWFSLPTSDQELVVSYRVTRDPSDNKTELKINGLFSYIESEEPKKFYLSESTVPLKPNAAVVDNTSTQSTTPDTKTPDTKTPDNAVTTVPDTKTPDTQTSTGKTNSTTTETGMTDTKSTATVTGKVEGADKGVNYKVQIMALHRALESAYFSKTYGITENIAVEMHEGYTKFTVGGFNEYSAARDHREQVRGKGVVGPFVTAYNSGKRITVQEALMISNQKWVR
jgi:hypothetical protein